MATAIAVAKVLRAFAFCCGKSRLQKRQNLSQKSAYFGPISGQIWVKLWDFLMPLFKKKFFGWELVQNWLVLGPFLAEYMA